MTTECQSSLTEINQPSAGQLTTSIRKRKFLWIILSIVIAIFIALIIIIPITIIWTKKINSRITDPITTSLTSTIIMTTKKCIFTGQMNFFIPIAEYGSLTTADVNGDNKFDIIYTNYEDKVRIFLNTGTGTFNKHGDYSTGYFSRPSSITTADLDNDDKPDIIVTNGHTSTVGVFLNTDTGIFKPQVIYSIGIDSGPKSVTTADVDGDKNVDIIVTNSNRDSIRVLFNTGIGTFGTQVTYSTGYNSTPNIVTTADLNGDNKSDIIVTNSNRNTVGVFLNTGNGTYSDQVIYPTGSGSGPRSVTTADVDVDKKLDIIVANEAGNTVGVFLNSGDGTFNDQVTYSTGSDSNPNPVTTGDVNGDNKPDIIVANYVFKKIGVFLNKGNGTFHNQVIYPTGIRSGGPICFTKYDVNSNEILDSIFAVSDAIDVRLSLRQRN